MACPTGTRKDDWDAVVQTVRLTWSSGKHLESCMCWNTMTYTKISIYSTECYVCAFNSFQAYASAISAWQVMFQKVEQELMPMNLTDAHKRGYAFDLTDGRLVFRTPYGQPDSFSTEVNHFNLVHPGI